MVQYAALDVSDQDTAIHVFDEDGRLVWKGKRASEPEVLATALRRHAPRSRPRCGKRWRTGRRWPPWSSRC